MNYQYSLSRTVRGKNWAHEAYTDGVVLLRPEAFPHNGWMKNLILGLVGLSLVGCATADLVEGKQVSMNAAEVTKACVELGEVYGKGGGAMGGMISDENLMRYASNDMRNKAAKMGATHVVQHGVSVGGGMTHSTTGNVSGTAFKCPKK